MTQQGIAGGRFRFRSGAVVLVVASVVLGGGIAIGSTIAQAAVTDCAGNSSTSWANANGGAWDDPNNWTNGVPGSTCAVITLPGTYTVTVSTGGAAAGVTLGASSGTQTLQVLGTTKSDGSPQGSILSVNNANLAIGTNGVLQLTASGANPGEATTTGNATIVNSGLVRTDQGTVAGTRDIQNSVTNNATGTIALHTNTITCGCGNTHHWDNSGTIVTDANTTSTFTGTAAGVLFTQSTGTFTNNGRTEISGGYTITGGTTSGNPIEVCGFVDAPGSGAAKFEFHAMPDVNCNDANGQISGDVGAATSILIHAATNDTLTSVSTPITNHGTITLDGGPGQTQLNGQAVTNTGTIKFATASTAPAAYVSAPLTNSGTLNVLAGSSAYINAKLVQSGGTVSVAVGAHLQAHNNLDLTGGTVANLGEVIEAGQLNHTGGSTTGQPILICGGNLNAPGPGTASFVIGRVANCDSMGIDGDIGVGDTVRVESAPAQLDVFFTPFTNRGSLTFASDPSHLLQMHVIGANPLVNDGGITAIGTNMETKVVNNGTWQVTRLAGVATNVSGQITQAAGSLMVDGTLNAAALTTSGGTVTVDGSLNVNGDLPVTGGVLQGGGTVVPNGSVINTGGTLHPGHSAGGNSPALLSITGNYTQGTGGTLAVDVAGSAPGTGYSRLAISGTAGLAGSLRATATHPQNATMHILAAASRSGTFTTTTFAGQTFSVAYPATGVDLHGAAPPRATAPPSVHGVARIGRVLTSTLGSFSGAPTAYHRFWLRCTAAGTGCARIAGATRTSYRVAKADVGHRLRVQVVATGPGGQGSADSAPTAKVPRPAFVTTGVGFSPRSFTAGRNTTLSFRVSLAARVTVSITHAVKGHSSHGRCSTSARSGRICSVTVTVLRSALRAAPGGHRVSIATSHLGAGTYRATVVLRDGFGRIKTVAVTLTVRTRHT